MVRSRTSSQKLSGSTYHLVSVPAGAQLAPHHGLQLQEMAYTPGWGFVGNEVQVANGESSRTSFERNSPHILITSAEKHAHVSSWC